MDWSQSLNVPPFFDGNNYAFWKVQMRAFLCSIDDIIWDVVEAGWTRLEGLGTLGRLGLEGGGEVLRRRLQFPLR